MKNKFSKINKKHSNKGFTLIETLVSLGLLAMILVISGGTVVSVLDINKRNLAISSVVNNLNYSIDSMIRDIKTGYMYKCNYAGNNTIAGIKNDINETSPTTADCVDGDSITLISTISGIDTVVKYEFSNNQQKNKYIKKTVYDTSGIATSYSITDNNNVNVDSLKFTVKNPDALDCSKTICDYGQPSVAIVIKGKAGNLNLEVSNFYLQTFISQRLIHLTDFKSTP